MNTIRVWYEKKGIVKYISHLDTVRCMDRVLRKSKLPVWYTEGFNPHIYTTFANPLSLGHESLCEIMEFRLEQDMDLNEVKDRLNAVLPAGFAVNKVEPAERSFGDIGAATYEVSVNCEEDALQSILSFFAKEEIITLKKSKKGMRETDIRPMLFAYSGEMTGESTAVIKLTLASGQNGGLNPALLLAACKEQTNSDFEVTGYLRTSLLDKNFQLF